MQYGIITKTRLLLDNIPSTTIERLKIVTHPRKYIFSNGAQINRRCSFRNDTITGTL